LKKGLKTFKLLTFLAGFQQKTPAKNDRRFSTNKLNFNSIKFENSTLL